MGSILFVGAAYAAFGTLIILAGRWIYLFSKNRELKQWEAKRAQNDAEHEARLLHQRKSTEKNHAGQVYNWLKRELAQYEDVGIRIGRIATNGSSYTIVIDRVVDSFMFPLPIVQIDYDFTKETDGYVCHLFYGATGPDLKLYVSDHNPKYGLEKLVIKDVREEAERARKNAHATF